MGLSKYLRKVFDMGKGLSKHFVVIIISLKPLFQNAQVYKIENDNK